MLSGHIPQHAIAVLAKAQPLTELLILRLQPRFRLITEPNLRAHRLAHHPAGKVNLPASNLALPDLHAAEVDSRPDLDAIRPGRRGERQSESHRIRHAQERAQNAIASGVDLVPLRGRQELSDPVDVES